MKDLEEVRTLLYGNDANLSKLKHPLHRDDELYKASNAQEQMALLESRKKQKKN